MSLSEREACVKSWLEHLIQEMKDTADKIEKRIHDLYEFDIRDKKAVDRFLAKSAEQLSIEHSELIHELTILRLSIGDIANRITIIELMAGDRELKQLANKSV